MWESLVEIDQHAFTFINSSWLNKFDSLWLFVTQLETWLPLYITFFILLFKLLPVKVNYLSIVTLIICTVTAIGLTGLVKNTVERIRPNNEPVLMDSIHILQHPENFSFWSGHTAVSMTVSIFVYLTLQRYHPSKWYWLIFIWPLLFASSRIFVGVHYPLDVLAGALVGLSLGFLFHKLFVKISQKLKYTT